MNKEKQKIAIAEACGLPTPYSRWSGADGDTLCHSVTVEDGLKRAKRVPDYTQDLNAMHEAECTLSDDQFAKYVLWLGPLTTIRQRQYISATAAQRAEAFLRTIGKWEDDK